MQNYKVNIDISDHFAEFAHKKIRDFNHPFVMLFITATNPDHLCYMVTYKIVTALLGSTPTIKDRILCRKVRKSLRIDKIILI